MMIEQVSLIPDDDIAPSRPNDIAIDVRGLPIPQGSMKLHRLPNGGTAARYPGTVYVWRGQVQAAVAAALEDGRPPFAGAVELRLGFDLPRPKSHYGTGKNARTVKASAPNYPTSHPDLDKLTRAIGDACTDAGLWHDDAQVVSITAAKRYTTRQPGVLIQVRELP